MKLFYGILIAIALMFVGCSDDDCSCGDDDDKAVGEMTNYSGCENSFAKDSDEPLSGAAECAFFEYDGNGGLFMRHENALWNCCLDRIDSDIRVFGSVITISDWGVESAPCDCVCLYNVEYEFKNLKPIEYSVKINDIIVCSIDLSGGEPFEYRYCNE